MTARFESSASIASPPGEVFEYLDDPTHLAAHMAKPSWAMAGGQMQLHLDAGGGREPGSHIRMAGRVLGLELALDESDRRAHAAAPQSVGDRRFAEAPGDRFLPDGL